MIVSKAQESLIARRYAKAFYELAAENKKTEAIAKDIAALQSMPESAEFSQFLKNPLVKRSEKVNVMHTLAKKAKFDALTTNFLGVIADNGRLAILSMIVNAVSEELASRRGEVKAEITSARKLTPDQLKKVTDTLKKVTGTDIDVVLKQDESILGGLKIKVGSLMIDQSVKTRLDRLERALKSDSSGEKSKEIRDAA